TFAINNLKKHDTICGNGNDSVSIGVAPVTGNSYSWSSNPSGFSSTLSNPVVSPAKATTYTITETNITTGCSYTNTVVVSVSLSGTYTIDASGIDSGSNFTTFNNAVNALTYNGICGPVVFNVSDGTYGEKVKIIPI